MKPAATLVILLLVSRAAAGGKPADGIARPRSPSPPTWPKQFQIKFEFAVPYIDQYQKGEFKYIYQVWQDLENPRQKVVRDDVEHVLILVKQNKLFQIFPAYDKLTCWASDVHRRSGPTLYSDEAPSRSPSQMAASAHGQQRRRLQGVEGSEAEQGQQAQQAQQAQQGPHYLFDYEKEDPAKYLTFVLPNLHEKRWQYVGRRALRRGDGGDEVEADLYEWDMSERNMTMSYKFYVSQDGVPLELWMLGVNLMTGGHKDEYIMKYYDYKVGPISDSEFEPPSGQVTCKDPEPDALMSHNQLIDSIRRHLPSMHHGDERYDRFVHAHGRRHRSPSEYESRRQVFHENARFIEGWNAQPGRHRVAMNRFGDWTREEFLAVILPKQYKDPQPRKGVRVERPQVTPHMLPKQLSWKGTGADSPVKDQAACGSCWSFSTIAAFEAAYFRVKGQQQLFSEQQLIDCAWEVANHGCYGGDQGRAFKWVLDHGGLARNEDYPYRGINDFCRKDVPETKFRGETVLVEGGELAVMQTLMTKGPMTVSVDASSDAFRFYAGGIFSLPDCAMDPKDLDHAIVLSGWGTDENGVDYWLAKNIWSPFWGEDGYIRITRRPNDCGIASEPFYVNMEILSE